ncbi:3'(2'),5'-bisphosphate nucleotidase [Nodosilinea sp. LEGE 07088]|uniref:3'(2'),5'-bisphosphate nucleotidase n=1 Tax=Nodosilinea sp. LEGE 07088 TaxID=2777968 RepID=UPI00187E2E66|nr:3'(2'),5'-bisphosphate nucleotidase [Nodosilinea sp. LEGE 07088]MBE9137417.1 3'(2'),5'-bisphosphate nucleotidase [Nodosilinea sp. LEGE 07088]
MAYEQEKQIAIAAVTQAALLCEAVRQGLVPQAIEKNDKSPVTIADYGAQAIVCKALATAFPADAVVGEEDTTDLRQPEAAPVLAAVTEQVQRLMPGTTDRDVLQSIDHGTGTVAPRYWTLDPIDGTKGFLRGDQYAIALALVEDGDLKVGVLGCPFLSFDGGETGLLLVAVRGEGTVMMPLSGGTPQPLTVAAADDRDHWRFVESVESGHGDQSQQSAIAQAVGITAPSMRMDSQAKYAAVAAGQAVLYLRLPSPKSPNYREKIWDHAAGVLVVEEAGGRVTDMHGKPLDFGSAARFPDNQGVVVSNGTIHDTVLAALGAGAPV